MTILAIITIMVKNLVVVVNLLEELRAKLGRRRRMQRDRLAFAL